MRAWRGVDNRLSFAPGRQRQFLLTAGRKLGMSWSQIAQIIEMHPRSLRDWVREKYHISEIAARKLSRLSKINLPKDIRLIIWQEHLRSASKIGCQVVYRKYGIRNIRELVDEDYRQRQWEKWWQITGQYQKHRILNQPKPVKKPPPSVKLAEFVGIVLGDGGITSNQIIITHHRIDDKLYGEFIKSLIRDLFEVEPGVHEIKNCLATNIFISRVSLVRYFINELGLKIGNKVKNQIAVPQWIKDNIKYYQACIRGMIDTDGSVFAHRYRVKGKEYVYKKLCFTNHSQPLRQSVYNVFKEIGLNPRMDGYFQVRLDSKADMKQYFKIIGTHNPKHLNHYTR